MAVLTYQAHADTKYDIYPPPRVVAEGFESNKSKNFKLIVVGIIILCLIAIIVQSSFGILRIVSIALLMASIHYSMYVLEKETE